MQIAIAGAGLIGRLLAWQLAERGAKVTLYDADLSGQSSAAYVAAAMLAPYSESVHAPRQVVLDGIAGLAIWPRWIQRLQALTGVNVSWQQRGSLVVAHRLDAGDLQQFHNHLQQSAEVPENKVRELDAQQLAACEPQLQAGFQSGLLVDDEACLDNRQLLQALFVALAKLNVECVEAKVASCEPHLLRLHSGQAGAESSLRRFDWVIDCRGIGAAGGFASSTDKLRGVRGEVIRVHAPEVNLSRPVRLMHPRHALYIVPREKGRYVVGATEIESESSRGMTVRSSMELLSALFCVHSGFAEAEIMSQDAALRPAFSDNQARVDHQQGLTQINGLYRHGFLLAPTVVNQALTRIAGLQEIQGRATGTA